MTEKLTMVRLQRDVDRVEAAQNTHEKECALRYGELNASIRDLKDGMKWVIRLAVGIMLGAVLGLYMTWARFKAPPAPPDMKPDQPPAKQ